MKRTLFSIAVLTACVGAYAQTSVSQPLTTSYAGNNQAEQTLLKDWVAGNFGAKQSTPAFPIQPGGSWSGALVVTIEKRPEFVPCLAPPGLLYPNFLGLGFTADARVLGGFNATQNKWAGGFSLGLSKQINSKINLYGGAAELFQAAGKPIWGGILSANVVL